MRRRAESRWVSRTVVDAVQFDLLREHGGVPGIHDEGALESALARPRHRWAYAKVPDLAALGASYAYGIVRNHPYHDGNKRTAFVTMAVFLGLNGYEIEADDAEVVTVMCRLAAGRMGEAALTEWVRAHLVELGED